ncbi:MAG TPA: hypothetical protein VF272_01295 [Candidatus Saccharimonadia bacterium]
MDVQDLLQRAGIADGRMYVRAGGRAYSAPITHITNKGERVFFQCSPVAICSFGQLLELPGPMHVIVILPLYAEIRSSASGYRVDHANGQVRIEPNPEKVKAHRRQQLMPWGALSAVSVPDFIPPDLLH